MSSREQVYPVSLLLRGQPCLVVGGRQVALSKIIGLLDVGAVVTVIAPALLEEVAALPVTVHARPYQPGDCDGFALVIAATGDRSLDSAIATECARNHTLINAADNPESCSFYLPAVLRRGDLSVGISTAGASPAVASWVREQIGSLLGEHFAEVVTIVGTTRDEIRSTGRSSEGLPWGELIAHLTTALAAGISQDAATEIATAWTAKIAQSQKTDVPSRQDGGAAADPTR